MDDYFNHKAESLFRSYGWEPRRATAVADWARKQHQLAADGDESTHRRGLIVTRSGAIVAQWDRTAAGPDNISVARITGSTVSGVEIGDEVGDVIPFLRKMTGEDLVAVYYWEVASLPSPRVQLWEALTRSAAQKAEERRAAQATLEIISGELWSILREAERVGKTLGKSRADLVRETRPAGHTNWRSTVDRALDPR